MHATMATVRRSRLLPPSTSLGTQRGCRGRVRAGAEKELRAEASACVPRCIATPPSTINEGVGRGPQQLQRLMRGGVRGPHVARHASGLSGATRREVRLSGARSNECLTPPAAPEAARGVGWSRPCDGTVAGGGSHGASAWPWRRPTKCRNSCPTCAVQVLGGTAVEAAGSSSGATTRARPPTGGPHHSMMRMGRPASFIRSKVAAVPSLGASRSESASSDFNCHDQEMVRWKLQRMSRRTRSDKSLADSRAGSSDQPSATRRVQGLLRRQVHPRHDGCTTRFTSRFKWGQGGTGTGLRLQDTACHAALTLKRRCFHGFL